MLMFATAQGALTLLAQITEPTPADTGHFGHDIAVAGDTLIVGSHGTPPGHGAAQVFRGRGASWTHETTLLDATPATDSWFGYDVDIQGNEAFVGAFQDPHSSLGTLAGSVNVYRRNGTTWSHTALLEPSNPSFLLYFGIALDVEGDTLAVGAWESVYMFVRQASGWVEHTRLTPSDGAAHGEMSFGTAVVCCGSRVAVAAHQRRTAGFEDVGAVYIFARNGASWIEESILVPNDPGTNSFMGISLAYDGQRIAAGAHGWPNSAGRGAVYLFEQLAGAWQQVQRLSASDGANNDNFGYSLALTPDRLYCGARSDNAAAIAGCGSLYAFERTGSSWSETQKFQSPTPVAQAALGCRQARVLNTLFVAAVSETHGGATYAGKIYVLGLEPTTESYCVSAVTTHGCVPHVSATGTPSATASSGFLLRADPVEGASSGLFFYGVSGRTAVPWGASGTSGHLCVQSPTQRTSITSSGGNLLTCTGSLQLDWNAFRASHPTSLGQPFAAGAVVNTQAWFRDPGSAKTTALSDAFEFAVQP